MTHALSFPVSLDNGRADAGQQPRPEYPRPQLIREGWLNLNGTWEFEIDHGDSGLERGLLERALVERITVPFAPESAASGIEHTDFMEAVWYRTQFAVPDSWAGKLGILHFGAVDHDTTVWVNDVEAVRHRGGFTPFQATLGELTAGEDVTIVVRARDSRHEPKAGGKQATWYHNTDCYYTRTTGIWQTVWVEAVDPLHLRRMRITPDVDSSSFTCELVPSRNADGASAAVRLFADESLVASATAGLGTGLSGMARLQLDTADARLWSPADPFLYTLEIDVIDGSGRITDHVSSYAGLRGIAIDGAAVLINGEHIFQRLVLDQGYWPSSLMTAPDDDALVRDIELGLEAGFNGARLHQKVFEERYLYHADRLGYLVWGEFGDWGVSGAGSVGHNQGQTASFITQWLEALERDVNHPAIIGWCPLNETHQTLHDRITVLDDVTRGMFLATKLADPSRPVIDASGYSHRVREVDVWDSHSYEQNPAAFAQEQGGLANGAPFANTEDGRAISIPYAGQPYFVSEFGGIWWNAELARNDDGRDSWGYGQRVASSDEFYARFAGLVSVLRDDASMFGYCYTQLTDTFQEQNGLYDFDRTPKFNMSAIRAIQTATAAYEARSRE
ncbi:MAG TPA: glycoside hydrolase family 2 TIM barrel-domain containing protein [Microbacteriaceae bacterium]|nr:glycoside hydrolase family 2 TIM barrel-domain containing protein [Microbacteriaceae bacterium]